MSHKAAVHAKVWLARMTSLQAFTQSWQTPLQGRYGPFISSVHRGTKSEQPITSVNAEQFVMTLLNSINLCNCRVKRLLSLKRAVWLYPHFITFTKLGMVSFKSWHWSSSACKEAAKKKVAQTRTIQNLKYFKYIFKVIDSRDWEISTSSKTINENKSRFQRELVTRV